MDMNFIAFFAALSAGVSCIFNAILFFFYPAMQKLMNKILSEKISSEELRNLISAVISLLLFLLMLIVFVKIVSL